jgi:hypothetical protein
MPESAPGADSSRLAYHADEAGDTAAVLRHGRAAAERGSATGSHHEAAAQYARVVRHADALHLRERGDLLAAWAREAQAGGAYEDASTALTGAIVLRRELGDPRTGEHLARLGLPYILQGRNAEADAASRAAIDLLETLPASAELAMAYGSRPTCR